MRRGCCCGSEPSKPGAISAAGAVPRSHTKDVERVALDACDVVIVRAIPRGSLEQIVFRVDTLHALAAVGVRAVNGALGVTMVPAASRERAEAEDGRLVLARQVSAEGRSRAFAGGVEDRGAGLARATGARECCVPRCAGSRRNTRASAARAASSRVGA